jgi:hypothetical protein
VENERVIVCLLIDDNFSQTFNVAVMALLVVVSLPDALLVYSFRITLNSLSCPVLIVHHHRPRPPLLPQTRRLWHQLPLLLHRLLPQLC